MPFLGLILYLWVVKDVFAFHTKRYNDGYTPVASACDTNTIFRGTDNRWFDRPESVPDDSTVQVNQAAVTTGGTLPGISREDSGGSQASSPGSSNQVPRGLMTHCPDARSIICDPVTNLFTAPNYVSLPIGDHAYEKFASGLFGYSSFQPGSFQCTSFTSTTVVRKLSGQEGVTLSPPNPKLVFHSMQIFGPTSNNCESPWAGLKTLSQNKYKNPPFFCIYSVATPNVVNDKSLGICSKNFQNVGVQPQDTTYQQTSGFAIYSAENQTIDPNCGVKVPLNNTVHTSLGSTDFFQVWMAPIQWEDRYDWKSLYFRDATKSALGYKSLMHTLNDRFVDCVPQAEKRRLGVPPGEKGPGSEICLPAHSQFERAPLLLNKNSCKISRQVECAPPPVASEVNEGTECYCSFPYTSMVDSENRDPWDLYCLSGDLSDPQINYERNQATSINSLGTLHGNDFAVSNDLYLANHLVREVTGFDWTYYDWTPVFTSPPELFTCPPPGYLTIVEDETLGKWVIKSALRPEYYEWAMNLQSNPTLRDLNFFDDLKTSWMTTWPDSVPEPNGPQRNVRFDPTWEHGKSSVFKNPGDIQREIEAYLNYKDYEVAMQFTGAKLVVKKSRRKAAMEGNSRTVNFGPGEEFGRCKISEGSRHYGSFQQKSSRWSTGHTLQCHYSLKLSYTKRTKEQLGSSTSFTHETVSYTTHNVTLTTPFFLSPGRPESPVFPYGYDESNPSKWILSNRQRSSKVDWLAEDTITYSCKSSKGIVSECKFLTTKNINSEAIAKGELQMFGVPEGHLNWSKHVTFGKGFCATTDLTAEDRGNHDSTDSSNGLLTHLWNLCLFPSEKYKEGWYENVVRSYRENETFPRFVYDAAIQCQTHNLGPLTKKHTLEMLQQKRRPNVGGKCWYQTTPVRTETLQSQLRTQQCDLTKSIFFANLFETSALKQYMKKLSNDADYLDSKISPFKVVFCPAGHEIIYRVGEGFRARGGYSWESDWVVDGTDHELSLDRLSGQPQNGLIGHQDVDSTTIELLAVYESTRYQCKYVFQTTVTLQIPFSASPSSYYRIPQFFYLSSIAKSSENLYENSRLVTAGHNPCVDEEDPDSLGIGCSTCQIRVDPIIYSNRLEFLKNEPTLILCDNNKIDPTQPSHDAPLTTLYTKKKPQPIWEYVHYFRAEIQGYDLPSTRFITPGFQAEASHPLHTTSSSIRYCFAFVSELGRLQCWFYSPTIPCKTNKQFVERG